MKKKQRAKYTEEFKQEAINLVLTKGYKITEAARNLDVSTQNLGRWIKEYKANGDQAFPGNGNLPEDSERIRELEAEVKNLKMEKEILKKATACVLLSYIIDEGSAPRYRLIGEGTKPPQAAVFKRHGGER